MALVLDGNNLLTSGVINSMTAQNASGTYVDFTGIPVGVKRVVISFYNVQKSGTTNNLLQLGTSSGLVTTGYTSRTAYTGDGPNAVSLTSTAGFLTSAGDAASTCLVSGNSTLMNITGNTWVFSVTGSRTESSYSFQGGGYISLSGSLSRIRFTTSSGSDTYSGGVINVFYE